VDERTPRCVNIQQGPDRASALLHGEAAHEPAARPGRLLVPRLGASRGASPSRFHEKELRRAVASQAATEKELRRAVASQAATLCALLAELGGARDRAGRLGALGVALP